MNDERIATTATIVSEHEQLKAASIIRAFNKTHGEAKAYRESTEQLADYVPALLKEIARLQTQLAACRREALEEAAKAVCFDCRTTQPFPPEVVNGCHVHLPYEKVPGGYCNCNAHPIHQIITKEAHGDSR